jgi:predicted Zn-dependent peptidase
MPPKLVKGVTQKILDNGLVLSHIQTSCEATTKIELIVRIGGLQEYSNQKQPNQNQLGYAHFLEHLMSFFTSAKYPNARLNQEEINNKGIQLNAWTSENTCGYWMHGLTEHRDYMFDLLFNNFNDPIYDNYIIDQEKEAVVKELEAISSSAWYPLDTLQGYLKYNGTNLQWSIMDEIQSVRGANKRKLENFRKQYYIPQHTSVAIISKHSNPQRLLNDIQTKYYSGIEGKVVEPCYDCDFIMSADPNLIKIYEENNMFSIAPLGSLAVYKLEFHFPINFSAFDSDKVNVLDVITSILTDGLGSRLYKHLRTRLGAIYHVRSDFMLDPKNYKYNCFVIETETSEKKIKEVFKAIIEELENLIKCFATPEEKLKYDYTVKMMYHLEKCSMSFEKEYSLYVDYITWGKDIKSVDTILKEKKNINVEVFKEVIRDIFGKDKDEMINKKMKVFYCGNDPEILKDIGEEFKLNIYKFNEKEIKALYDNAS